MNKAAQQDSFVCNRALLAELGFATGVANTLLVEFRFATTVANLKTPVTVIILNDF